MSWTRSLGSTTGSVHSLRWNLTDGDNSRHSDICILTETVLVVFLTGRLGSYLTTRCLRTRLCYQQQIRRFKTPPTIRRYLLVRGRHTGEDEVAGRIRRSPRSDDDGHRWRVREDGKGFVSYKLRGSGRGVKTTGEPGQCRYE